MLPPAYFDAIRNDARELWNTLESDPVIAAPWHQLFKQVQSPRHVLSELLQNADDADATEADVRMVDGRFEFSHNGSDFTATQLESLCRFGYSNKRALHTIGFRGIGFKSTFSLGDEVRIHTPTLKVAFAKKRFTEPVWLDGTALSERTVVSVDCVDALRRREIEKNLAEWIDSPVSLLFFRNLRTLTIDGTKLQWKRDEAGPVPGSAWMVLNGDREKRYLLARSAPVNFPREALEEIAQERLLSSNDGFELPASEVELVLGAAGRLYVVLPTGVHTSLPFACNAPFIQDPARLKIKDPSTSPTNRWLLERLGQLASSTMLAWLSDTRASLAAKSEAYALLPDTVPAKGTIEAAAADIVVWAFGSALEGNPYVLSATGSLALPGCVTAVPGALHQVWSPNELRSVFLAENQQLLAHEVQQSYRARLLERRALVELDTADIISVLQKVSPPKPARLSSLLIFWEYLVTAVPRWQLQHSAALRGARVVPAVDIATLQSAESVVRLGERRALQSAEDWSFLGTYLQVLDPSWVELVGTPPKATTFAGMRESDDGTPAQELLRALRLADASDVGVIISQAAKRLFAGEFTLSAAVRIAEIGARLQVDVDDHFLFVCRDGSAREANSGLVVDLTGQLESLLPKPWRESHLLSDEYGEPWSSCTREDWTKWIGSGNAGVASCPIPIGVERGFRSRTALERELGRRGYSGVVSKPYKSNDYLFQDWDFEGSLWTHWRLLAVVDKDLFGRLGELILALSPESWSSVKYGWAQQRSTAGYRKWVTERSVLPEWVLKLRQETCLLDSNGTYRKPEDLLRRTASTEPLLDVEPFVHRRYDTRENEGLLDLLGVSSAPTSVDGVLARLRAMSAVGSTITSEADRWYQRLDRLATSCPSEILTSLRDVFAGEPLILSEGGAWVRSNEVFVRDDADIVPGAHRIRGAMADLSLWRQLGVRDRPTADLAMQWLSTLSSYGLLDADAARRVRAISVRYAERVWYESAHWLSLTQRWTPVTELEFGATVGRTDYAKDLHTWVRAKTADLTGLSAEVIRSEPFVRWDRLAARLTEEVIKPKDARNLPVDVTWLKVFGALMSRVELSVESRTLNVRQFAREAAASVGRRVSGLETIPYLDGVPAGTARPVDAVWLGHVLYTEDLSKAKLAKIVPALLVRIVDDAEIGDALHYCYGRSSSEIDAYLRENFRIAEKLEAVVSLSGDVQVDEEKEQDGESPAIGAESSVVEVEPDLAARAGQDNGPDTVEFTTEVEDDHPRVESDIPAGHDGPMIDQNAAETAERVRAPGLMVRFAVANGFRMISQTEFSHPSGDRILKSADDLFPWERTTAAGDIVCRYWAKEHSLDIAPLEISAARWRMLEMSPNETALLLLDSANNPVELRGSLVRSMKDDGVLTLYPASYRISMSNDS